MRTCALWMGGLLAAFGLTTAEGAEPPLEWVKASCFGTAKNDNFEGAAAGPDGSLYLVGNAGMSIERLPGNTTPVKFGNEAADARCGCGFVMKLSPDASEVLGCAEFAGGILHATAVAATDKAVYVGGYASDGLEPLLKERAGLMAGYPLRAEQQFIKDGKMLEANGLPPDKPDPIGDRPWLGRLGAPCVLRFSTDLRELQGGTYLEGWQQVYDKNRNCGRDAEKKPRGPFREFFWQPINICPLKDGDVVVAHDGGYFRMLTEKDREIAAKLEDEKDRAAMLGRLCFYDTADYVSRLSGDLTVRRWKTDIYTPPLDPKAAGRTKPSVGGGNAEGWPRPHYGSPRTHRMRMDKDENLWVAGWSATMIPWWSPFLWRLDPKTGAPTRKLYEYDPLTIGGAVADTALLSVAVEDSGDLLTCLISDGGNCVMGWGPRGNEGQRMTGPVIGPGLGGSPAHFWGQAHRVDGKTFDGLGGAKTGPYAWTIDAAGLPDRHFLALGRWNAPLPWTKDAWWTAGKQPNPNAFLRVVGPGYNTVFWTAIPGFRPFELAPIGGDRYMLVGFADKGTAPTKDSLVPEAPGGEDAYFAIVKWRLSAEGTRRWELKNTTGHTYTDEVFRLPVEAPGGPVTVTEDGKEIAAVVDTVEGERRLYVCTTIEPGKAHRYEIVAGEPKKFAPRVKVESRSDGITLDNGRFAIRLPARLETSGAPPCPILALKVGDRWAGAGRWNTGMKLKGFSAAVVDDGQVMGKVRLRYEFDGMAGLNDDLPAYAEVDVTAPPDRPFAIVEERHEMSRLSAWEFEPTAGWKATRCLRGRDDAQEQPLAPGSIPYQPPELIANLLPRWNQHGGKDALFASAADEERLVGAFALLQGYWYWPHDNAIRCLVRESRDSLTFHCPTLRGRRYWLLVAGPVELATGREIEAPDPRKPGQTRKTRAGGIKSFATRHGYESLDAIVHAIPIRDWEGAAGQCRIRWPFSGINPTTGRAGLKGEEDLVRMGQPRRDIGNLTWVQSCLSPHTYGSYWLFSSPQNPNFFTDYLEHAVYAACSLREHPRFPELAKWVEQVVREDMFHSVTLPGGAGNECPGYMLYACMHGYREMAQACKRYLGFDPTTWPRWKAAGSFVIHLSQPWGGGLRGKHPGGDTHGGGHPHGDIREEVKQSFGVEEDVTAFKTEELPNFGVIFRNRCGTDQETYLAFKSGPARGHFHGDQLSFHFCENALPCVVDHHCSYGPRAGQEHMHNRVAFFTDRMPFGNMDGFERVIAFKTTEKISAAIGQVESWRLRNCVPLPSENWHEEYPQVPFDRELKYRRTIVHVLAEPGDYFVIRDQFDAPQPIGAALCFHVWDNQSLALKGTLKDPGNSAELKDATQDFSNMEVQPGWVATIGRQSYEVRSARKDTLTLDRNIRAETKKGEAEQTYCLFRPLFARREGKFTLDRLTVFCAKPQDFRFRFFPWCHWNHGQEATQGLRFETRGLSGEFISVMYPGNKAPEMAALEGGVKVGEDVITFAGGIDDDDGVTYVTARAAGASFELTGKDIDMDRSQGEIGLFVPDAGYPFGEIPKWLIRQRIRAPDWAPDWAKQARGRRQ